MRMIEYIILAIVAMVVAELLKASPPPSSITAINYFLSFVEL